MVASINISSYLILWHYFSAFIAGLKDANAVNPDVTLEHFGLDSLMDAELRQIFQHYYDLTLSEEEVRALTFAKLDELSSSHQLNQNDLSPADAAVVMQMTQV